jgi:hypothetical protein
MSSNFIAQPMGLMFRKRSPLVEQFNLVIMERQSRINRLLENQMTQKCFNHFFPEEAMVKVGYTPLNMMAMSGAFGLWFLLILIALFVTLSEFLMAYSGLKCSVFMGCSQKTC